MRSLLAVWLNMQLWRIAGEKWALDRTGDGARLYGGRWNPLGWPALYAGINVEICVLEKFVNLADLQHPKLLLVSIQIPDEPKLYYQPVLKSLPKKWDSLPIAAGSQEFGKQWLKSCDQLVMLVPSVIVPEAMNAMINPQHPAMSQVKIQVEREFKFDSRMLSARSKPSWP